MKHSKIILWLKELRAPFCTASTLPVIIGTAAAYSQTGHFDLTLCILAVCAIAAIHLGANIANDYFDHVSRNDWLNDNKTPFSGGSRMIQNNLLSPKEVLIGSVIFFSIGAGLGIAILAITKSLFVLALGLMGITGGYSYTAPPLKLGYRTAGEITIGLLFGILPVYGAYYIQTGMIDFVPFFPALFAAILIFLVIFANEFPDFSADRAANKKTLVVILGVKNAANFYKAAVITLCVPAIIYSIGYLSVYASAVLLVPLSGIGGLCIANADAEKLSQKGYFALSRATIILHTAGCLALIAAILLSMPV